MHFVYILKSDKNSKHYVGCTNNLQRRIDEHNRGENRSTKLSCPWKLIWFRSFGVQKDAYDFEKLIKSYKGGNAFKRLIYPAKAG